MNIHARINIIAGYIEKGEKAGAIVKKFTEKWQVSKRTIEAYMAIAGKKAAKRAERKEKIIEKEREDVIALMAREEIVSDLELEALLIAIAKGELVVEETVTIGGIEKTTKYSPTPFERILAIDKIWKKRGVYSAKSKQAGNQKPVIQYNFENARDAEFIEGIEE